MKITLALIDKLIRLRDGDSLPASQLRGEWVDELMQEGILVNTSHGTHKLLRAPQSRALCTALIAHDERFSDMEHLRKLLVSDDVLRSVQASSTGNSKIVPVRSCPGFSVNTYEPLLCRLNGKSFVVSPQEGSFLYVHDWKDFAIPSDVVVVGIENMENFRLIRMQRHFFEHTLGQRHFLFVSRYPQSSDLVSWLKGIPNRYIHFGDFDLAGINIFLSEFQSYIGTRASFLIPNDIEKRLAAGSRERYDSQYQHFHKLSTDIQPLQSLIDLINKYHRCYDQEGYIEGGQ